MNKTSSSGVNIFLIAGEASGDLLGARLMRALRHKLTEKKIEVRFTGVGGKRMQTEGQEQIFPMDDLAVMGMTEVLPRLPKLLQRIRQVKKAILEQKPDALITIDSPDFNFRVAKSLKGKGIKLIHYVAPTVWAWRPGRAKKVAKFLDHLLALFPFEPPYFIKEGLPCTFVGHPLIESGAGKGSAEAFAKHYPQVKGKRLITVLPGSRHSEISRLLPVFAKTLERLHARYPSLMAVIPTVPQVASLIEEAVRGWSVPTLIVQGDDDKYDAFAASEVALAASGTVALELALAGLPSVITYKVSSFTAWLSRRLVKVKYANLVNIMHDRMVVPEFLQESCRDDLLAEALEHLMDDTSARDTQKKALSKVSDWLGRDNPEPPSERAADVVTKELDVF